uniref:F-box domain-containing protein n=1 Tax=Romanomermis culicivorax TaxID=13658 RepID=A0A915L046_ROMCU
MDDILIITEILKYFDFEELCLAERINPNFKNCVESELRRLRYFDFGRIFTGSLAKLIEKIQRYCSGLHELKNLNYVICLLSFVQWEGSRLFSFDPFT